MGFYCYSDTTRQEAIRLRKAGKSYSEIRKELKIKSKGTLSVWFRELKLSNKERKRLVGNMLLAQKRGLLKFNRERSEIIRNENQRSLKEASASIPQLSQKDLLLVGTALYWGEGTKGDQYRLSITFSNSDPAMVVLFMRFVREVLKIQEEKIRAGIRIHPNIKEEGARKFWSKVTRLPVDRFYITKQISSASKLKRLRRFLPFGTVAIRINNRTSFYRVKGYIEGLARQA